MDIDGMNQALTSMAKLRERAAERSVYICKHCGVPVTRYGPETYHTESTLIFCQSGKTKATAVKRDDESTQEQ